MDSTLPNEDSWPGSCPPLATHTISRRRTATARTLASKIDRFMRWLDNMLAVQMFNRVDAADANPGVGNRNSDASPDARD